MTKTNIKKTKITITIMASLVIGMIMLSPTTVLPNVFAEFEGQHILPTTNLTPVPPAQESKCTATIMDQSEKVDLSLDNEKAKNLAVSSSEFSTMAQGYAVSFDSTSSEGSYDPSTCKVTWNDVNVVYHLTQGGKYVKSLYVTEDSSLTKIMKISEKKDKVNGATVVSTNWSGWQFYHPNSNPPPSDLSIWEAKATFAIPVIKNPNLPSPGNCANQCDTSVWTGLADTYGSSATHIAQAGSDSNIGCSTCTPTYSMWYEDWVSGGSATTCPNSSPSSGDSLTVDVKDTTQNPQASSSSYVTTIVDNTHSQNNSVCTTGVSTTFALNNPEFADYIIERAGSYGGSSEELGEFDTAVAMTGSLDWSGTLTSIYTPYSTGTGYYYETLMENPYPADTYQNIVVGTPNGGGTFNQWWQTSQCTYTPC